MLSCPGDRNHIFGLHKHRPCIHHVCLRPESQRRSAEQDGSKHRWRDTKNDALLATGQYVNQGIEQTCTQGTGQNASWQPVTDGGAGPLHKPATAQAHDPRVGDEHAEPRPDADGQQAEVPARQGQPKPECRGKKQPLGGAHGQQRNRQRRIHGGAH